MIKEGCQCSESTKVSRVKVEENGKKAIFLNDDRAKFVKVKLDGCLVKEKTAADWIVAKEGVGTVVVELKGKDVGHALDQVDAGLKYVEGEKIYPEKKQH